jgi:OOP family OmpA-OmpF porin
MRPYAPLLLLMAIAGPLLTAQETNFTVRLSRPLSTASAHKGDPVSATVIAPDKFKGDTLRGTVAEAKSGRSAALSVSFDTLDHAGRSVPISATVSSLANSKGQQNVDENGHAVSQSNRNGNSNAARQIGSSLGGFLGGRKGVAISTATDVGTALATVRISGEGPDLTFAAGSQFSVSVNSRGGPDLSSFAPNASEADAQRSAPTPSQTSATMATTAASASQPVFGAGQPDLKAVKIDFIPGEKTVFYDDFSDMAEDEPPPHWKLRDGKVELRTGGNVHQLTTVCPARLSLSSESFTFPKDFTMEIEAVLSNDGPSMDFFAWPKGVEGGQAPAWRIAIQSDQVSMDGPNGDKIGTFEFHPHAENRPIEVALWVQNGRARGYVDGQRFADVNQMFVPAKGAAPDHWTIRQRCDRLGSGPQPDWMGIRSVRVAESAPDFSAMISGTGKYVTHAIHFDTDSDRIKPESAPVLKTVVAALQKNPNLKLEIDGFTDSTGNSAHNLDLSKRRAEAIRTVLVSQFNLDGERLTSNGFGADKPVASNDTANGRAQNRRVEFLKR